MTLPFVLPDWLPWWVPIVVLVPALLWALAFLLLPFSVIGVKGRLEGIEARLDEIQGEIRSLALRLPEPLRGTSYEELTPYAEPDRSDPRISRPPIPPAPRYPGGDDEPRRPPLSRDPGVRPRAVPRAEPRLDRPR